VLRAAGCALAAAATLARSAPPLLARARRSTRRSTAKLQRDIETLGATVSARVSRETLCYSGTALRGAASVEGLVAALAEAMTQPALHYWEVNEAKDSLAAYVAAAATDPRTALLEAVHAAAFGAASPLGRSAFATHAGLPSLDADAVRAFLAARFAANKMVVAATSAWK
jgi:predicted Zn-dependent peptidase